MEKKPFHQVVLSEIEKRIPLVAHSTAKEMEIYEYCKLLCDSILSDEGKEEVRKRLNEFIIKPDPLLKGSSLGERFYLQLVGYSLEL
jgi:hypothetical protein